jgi:hypothetical protein
MYAVTTLPLLRRTLAVFLSPELGFFGFVIPVLRHTPFISGRLESAGERRRRARCSLRQPRRTWLYVASALGVDEKLRVVIFDVMFVVNRAFLLSLERIEEEEGEANRKVDVWEKFRVEDGEEVGRYGCLTRIVGLGM